MFERRMKDGSMEPLPKAKAVSIEGYPEGFFAVRLVDNYAKSKRDPEREYASEPLCWYIYAPSGYFAGTGDTLKEGAEWVKTKLDLRPREAVDYALANGCAIPTATQTLGLIR